MEDTEIIQFENDIIPFNQRIDVRDDEEFEKVKANLNDYEMVLVTSKTRSKFSMSIFTKGNFWDYGRPTKKEVKIRPKYIVSTGAHTAGPMCLIGKIFGSKIIFIETFANSCSKSRTGTLVYKFADLFIVQWEEMLTLYPNSVYGGWIF